MFFISNITLIKLKIFIFFLDLLFFYFHLSLSHKPLHLVHTKILNIANLENPEAPVIKIICLFKL